MDCREGVLIAVMCYIALGNLLAPKCQSIVLLLRIVIGLACFLVISYLMQ